jgi:ABC-type enterochelin transport system substrate-binding protein
VNRETTATALIALLLALALTGCGTSNSIATNANNDIAQAKMTEIAANISIAETSNPASLPQLTDDYVVAVQGAESVIGADQAKQKLTDMAAQIGPYCASCAQSLSIAAAQIQ